MKKVIFLILMNIPVLLFSQTEFGSYNWDTFPVSQTPDTVKCVNGVAVSLERRIFETYVNSESSFEEIFVYHRKVKTDSHDALSIYNKIYISLDKVIEILSINARFIAPNGKITILPKESIKQISNMDNNGDFKTFAIEGAEIGGQIEYYYVLRRKFNPFSGYYIQDALPRSNVEIIFAYPSKIAYLIKTYNGLPAFKINTDNPEKTYQKCSTAYIPPVEEEKYASYKADLMRFEFTHSYNHYNSALRRYSWNTGCENTYRNIFDLSKNDKVAAMSLYKQITTDKVDVEQQVRAIENWIKTNLSIKRDNPHQKDLSDVIKLKQADNSAAIRLFVAVLLSGNINFEFVGTGKKSSHPFDPDFNGINYVDNYLIYFPAINKYLIPDDTGYRLGLIPAEYQGEYGLFMRPVSYNESIKTLAYDIRKIPTEDRFVNNDSLLINISLSTNQTDIMAKIHRSMNGLLGGIFQNVFVNLTEEKKKELAGQLYQVKEQNADISSLKIKNDQPNDIGLKPIIFDISLKWGELVENAGNDLIIHIGETIGKQSELYQEHSRKLPIQVGILHNYYREVVFQIPSGYRVTNPENMEMNVCMKNGDKVSCIFTSNARIEGNQLIIVSHEYYTDQTYPADRYTEFRDVINAAADFNKKTIMLKKI